MAKKTAAARRTKPAAKKKASASKATKSARKKAAGKVSAPKKTKRTPAKSSAATAPAKKTAKKGVKKTAAKKKTARKNATAPRAASSRKKPKRSAASAAPKRARITAARTATLAAAASSEGGEKRRTVDGYVSKLNDWRRDCVAGLRKMIKKTAPKASESVKWAQPVYEHHGPFAWIKAHAKHVNLGFWRGVELPDPRKLLQGTGAKMRHIKLSSLKDAGKKELQEFVRVAAQLNELKGNPTRPKKTKSKGK